MEEGGRQPVCHGGTVNLSCHADTKTKGRLKFSDGLFCGNGLHKGNFYVKV